MKCLQDDEKREVEQQMLQAERYRRSLEVLALFLPSAPTDPTR